MARSGSFLMTQKCLKMEWRFYNLSAQPSQNKEQKCIFSGTKILCKTPVENIEPVVIRVWSFGSFKPKNNSQKKI